MENKVIAVMLAALTLIALAGCGQNSGGSPENGTIDVVKGEESYAEPIAASVPENAEIPEFYVPVSIPGVSEQVYAFVDTEGITQLRVYARQERFENGVFADAKTGFFACGLECAEDREAEGAEQYLYADGKAPTYKIVITEPAENDMPGSPVIKRPAGKRTMPQKQRSLRPIPPEQTTRISSASSLRTARFDTACTAPAAAAQADSGTATKTGR